MCWTLENKPLHSKYYWIRVKQYTLKEENGYNLDWNSIRREIFNTGKGKAFPQDFITTDLGPVKRLVVEEEDKDVISPGECHDEESKGAHCEPEGVPAISRGSERGGLSRVLVSAVYV